MTYSIWLTIKSSRFIDQISNADTVAAVEQIVADAKLADELALQQAETETQIDEMAYLSDDEKASYKDRVARQQRQMRSQRLSTKPKRLTWRMQRVGT